MTSGLVFARREEWGVVGRSAAREIEINYNNTYIVFFKIIINFSFFMRNQTPIKYEQIKTFIREGLSVINEVHLYF